MNCTLFPMTSWVWTGPDQGLWRIQSNLCTKSLVDAGALLGVVPADPPAGTQNVGRSRAPWHSGGHHWNDWDNCDSFDLRNSGGSMKCHHRQRSQPRDFMSGGFLQEISKISKSTPFQFGEIVRPYATRSSGSVMQMSLLLCRPLQPQWPLQRLPRQQQPWRWLPPQLALRFCRECSVPWNGWNPRPSKIEYPAKWTDLIIDRWVSDGFWRVFNITER